MEFEERINKVLKDHAVNKTALAIAMEMPYTTFLFKCKRGDTWTVNEARRLTAVLKLTEDEFDFLWPEVT